MDHYLDQPREVSLETLTKCNAACTFCPYPTLDRIGTKMSDELIERLVVEMESFEYQFAFSPFKVNEPLLDKRTIPLCREMVKRTKAVLRIFSNGSTLTLKNIDAVAGLDRVAHLWISLNDYRADEYKQLMNLNFEHTTRNLDTLHDTDFPHPVVLSAVGWPDQAFVDYCKNRWPKFETMVIEQSAWIDYIGAQRTDVPDTPCSRWWELSIMADGIVSLCCMDGEGEYAIGDLNKNTLLEVYRNTRDRRLGMSRLSVSPCNGCTY